MCPSKVLQYWPIQGVIMTKVLDIHENGIQQKAEVREHVEIENYKKQKSSRSRLSSYILNALYNSNTSFWSIAGIESLCQSFELSIITWPLYLVAGIFTLGNLAYDIFISTEQDKKHKNKVDELSTVLSDEKLNKWAQQLKNLGNDIELMSYAKNNTTDIILNDMMDEYFTALEYIDTQITNEDLNAIQIAQLKKLRDQLRLQLKKLSTELHDQELSYRVNVCINENINTSTEEYNLPLIAQAFIWLAKNFKTFTTGAITSTGATLFMFSILGFSIFSGFWPFALATIVGVGIIGGICNHLLNLHYFDAAESEFEQRKGIKNALKDKSALLKSKVNLQTLEYQSKLIIQHEIAEKDIPEIETIDDDYVPREILKIEKPSQLRQYLFPILVGAFALYEGYSIAYNLIAPILFVGLQSLASFIPVLGVSLALLHASMKIIEYVESNKEVDNRFEELNKKISHEKVQLWQHKLRRAGLNTNVADLIYNSSRKELLGFFEEEYQSLMQMIDESDANTDMLSVNLQAKINKNISKIRSTTFKTKLLEIFNRSDEIEVVDENIKIKALRFCREAIDFFEAHWADAFEGATTICALAAGALFLLMSTPAITVIIPVLVCSFILGGLGTILFQTFFENSSQYSLMNIKNTEEKLEDKVTIYKMLQSTLIAQASVQENVSKNSNSYNLIDVALDSGATNSSSTTLAHEIVLSKKFEKSINTPLSHFVTAPPVGGSKFFSSPTQGGGARRAEGGTENPFDLENVTHSACAA